MKSLHFLVKPLVDNLYGCTRFIKIFVRGNRAGILHQVNSDKLDKPGYFLYFPGGKFSLTGGVIHQLFRFLQTLSYLRPVLYDGD